MFGWGTGKTAQILRHHRIKRLTGRLKHPLRLRDKQRCETARSTDDVARESRLAFVATCVAIGHIHRGVVGGNHGGGHLRRARCMRDRTCRESGKDGNNNEPDEELHTDNLPYRRLHFHRYGCDQLRLRMPLGCSGVSQIVDDRTFRTIVAIAAIDKITECCTQRLQLRYLLIDMGKMLCGNLLDL